MGLKYIGSVANLGVNWYHVDAARRLFAVKLGALSSPFGFFLGPTIGLILSPTGR